MESKEYSLSFTTASFAFKDTVLIARLYSELGDWGDALYKVKQDSLLGSISENSTVKIFGEIKKRLVSIPPQGIELIANGDKETKTQVILLSICSTYLFIKELIVEILYDKVVNFQHTFFESDYTKYVRIKSELYEKLESISDSTKERIRTNTLAILTEAQLIEKTTANEYQIIPQFPTSEVRELIKGKASLFHCLLASE